MADDEDLSPPDILLDAQPLGISFHPQHDVVAVGLISGSVELHSYASCHYLTTQIRAVPLPSRRAAIRCTVHHLISRCAVLTRLVLQFGALKVRTTSP